MVGWYKKVKWPENLFRDLIWLDEFEGPEMPEDFLGTLEYILHSTMSEREMLVLRCRYQNEETYRVIGLRIGVQQERVRQILNKAIRRMRHPSRLKYLKYGIAEQVERFGEQCRERAFKEGYQEGIKNAKCENEEIEPIHNPYGEQNIVPISSLEELPIEDLDLSVRAYNCMRVANIRTVGQLMSWSKAKLRRVRNLGKLTLLELEETLQKHDIQLREE